MSYYKQIAEMFDLKLNEEFILADTDGNRYNECKYMFTELGLLHSTDFGFNKSSLLDAVLRGALVVKKLPWKPKERCEFYYYGVNGAIKTIWTGTTFDYYRWKFGNCFKTREEAETKGKKIMEAIQKEYRNS